MKHLLTLALLVCLGTFASAQIPSYIPTNGLVGWWPFNGNANDESGNGNHGTVNGATLAADRFGNAGKAYSLLAGNNISTGIYPSNVTQISYSAWFKTNNGGCIIGSQTPGNVKNLVLAIHTNTTSSGNLGTALWVVDKTGYSVGWMSQLPLNPLFNDNNWHHIVGIFNCPSTKTIQSLDMQLFVDGLLINTISQNVGLEASPLNGSSNIVFGKNRRWIDEGFDGRYSGLLDDIGIWNRALTAQEVTNLYQGSNVAAQEIQPSALQVYPNPAKHEVTLQVLPHHLGKTVTVVNTLGQNVLQTQLQNERQTISLGTLPAGVYTAFLNDDRRTTVKLIKD